MRVLKQNLLLWAAGMAAALSVALGWLGPHPWLALIGLVAAVCLLVPAGRQWRWPKGGRDEGCEEAQAPCAPAQPPIEVIQRKPADPTDTASLIENMLLEGRFALLLRPQIAAQLDEDQFQRALACLEDAMALVPDGEVVVGQIEAEPEDERPTEEEIAARRGRVVRVEGFFLDRHPVTNRQFYEFVAAGGYEQVALWEPSVLPAVLDFVDQTALPGPRFWSRGCYPPELHDHPVVGVSWYEAAAYARWVGKRLPSDAEWIKAASWPVSVTATTRVQRRYPWGDTMDRTRANLWGSGPKGTVPVGEFGGGVSVGGVYQLVGNVWEWMRGPFAPTELRGQRFVLEAPMKSIRGGAFNTYFDNQATCQFQSGEAAIARKRNIGFRCAVGVCDVVLARAPASTAVPAETDPTVPMEVGA
jgi:iron(II)-dependent oxidoreductase